MLKPKSVAGRQVPRKGKLGIGDCLGKRTEAVTMSRLGARLTLNSGATEADKGDGVLVTAALSLRLEHKSTIKDSMGIKLDWFQKIASEAHALNQTPALILLFTDQAGKPRKDGKWVAIPEDEFRRLTGEAL